MKNPMISVITPTFNAEDNIESCILSVIGQSHKNVEHLIIDGLSADKTLEIVKKYAERYPHIRMISEKDGGIYDAMNKGLGMSNGEWIYFLGSDDVFSDDKVLETVFRSAASQEADVIYGNVQWGNSGRLYDGKFDLLKLLDKNICHQAIFVRKKVFETIGRFDIRYKTRADWESNLRWFVNDEIKKEYFPMTICKYNITGLSSKGPDPYYVKHKMEIIKSIIPDGFFNKYERVVRLREKLREKSEGAEKIDKYQKELDRMTADLAHMRGSNFWKMKNIYLKVKSIITRKNV